MTISIHQPNLFPWLGYFQKIQACDKFVFLDHTINNRSESTYTKRVECIDNQYKSFFITIPIQKKESNFLPLTEWDINFNTIGFPNKILNTLFFSYKKHPYFEEVFPLIEKYFSNTETNSIVDKNIDFILSVCNKLGIQKEFMKSSSLNLTNHKTELLVDIVTSLKGNTYLSGKGGNNYQDPLIFQENNIELKIIKYNNFEYNQLNSKSFVKGLSILDCLMNTGFDNTKSLLI